MFKQKAHIGTLVDTSKILIHEDLIERFQAALYDRKEGDTHILPLQALATFGAHDKAFKLLGIKLKNVLHSREILNLISSPKLGDEIEILTFISDVYEQHASETPMGFVVVETVGRKKSSFLFSCARTSAVRGGFPRGA
jgi:hypothetical protein